MKKLRWASVVALTAALLAGLTPPASAASAVSNEVRNTGAIGIGAIQVFDGVYKVPGQYDDLIPAGRFSGYVLTAGLYIGPHHCVRMRQWIRGTEQNPPTDADLKDPWLIKALDPTRGFQTEFPVGGALGWDVRALPLSNSLCDHPAPSAATGQFRLVS